MEKKKPNSIAKQDTKRGIDSPDAAYRIACEKLRIRRICDRIPAPTTDELAHGLDALAIAPPPIQRRILDAAATCVAVDGVIEPAEHELLRAVAATMNVPLPPGIEIAAMNGRRATPPGVSPAATLA